ncbi:GH23130 [Drosophila grimshawi]|uniref:GH23130 n=2 Tax=Drosophila grimshawi TaxID=7222 RepID=B4JVJ1_DROGR|nr:GH23130 [Drosophila grimshawi]
MSTINWTITCHRFNDKHIKYDIEGDQGMQRVGLGFKAAAVCLWLGLILGIIGSGSVLAQENAQLQIPPSLIECYNSSYFMNRDNRLPANMDTLISLIEKVEQSYAATGYQVDIRTVSVALLHRFRQDGIKRAPGVNAVQGVIPYSPTGFQFPKLRILLSRLLPGNANNFPNSSLTSTERCSIHFMLSSTFDTRQRGDENTVCGQLSQYRSQRLPRALSRGNNFVGDAEWLSDTRPKRANYVQQKGSQALDYDSDWAYAGNEGGTSQCPVEDGVVRTPWGTVSAGTLIAGVATGLQQQNVPLNTLLQLATQRRGAGGGGGRTQSQTTASSVDNRWAATLAGDLAEVTLVQVPVSVNNVATVGATGGWNDTVLPHWYFLSQRNNLEATDAEIRGGLDGLIIAMNVQQWRTQASGLKLSQLLRMYYSATGVLSSGIQACSRQQQFPNVAPSQQMQLQTSAFAQVLDREMQLKVTLEPAAIAEFANTASLSLVTYVPQSLNDVSCTASNNQDLSDIITPMTNLYVFMDTTWQYSTIVDYLAYILQQLNIHPHASSVTMLSAYDGSIIVNTTNLITDFYQQWNYTIQSQLQQGFNLPNVLRSIQNLTQTLLNEEQTNSSVSGRSLVALIMPNQANVNDGDSNYVTTQLQYIYEQIPDLRFIYYGGGSIQRFSNFVRDSAKDLFPLMTGSTVATSAGPVARRIALIPRRIINPRCGSAWYTNSWGTDQMYQYIRPGTANFYRVAPNYFFGSGANRVVTIQSQNGGSFTVCSSRTYEWPQQNSTANGNGGGTTGTNSGSTADQSCVQISGNSYSYDLSNACNGYYTITQCPPLYLSVQPGTTSTTSCTQDECQTPDQWRYVVSVVNMGCYNGVSALTASFFTLLLALLLQQSLQ